MVVTLLVNWSWQQLLKTLANASLIPLLIKPVTVTNCHLPYGQLQTQQATCWSRKSWLGAEVTEVTVEFPLDIHEDLPWKMWLMCFTLWEIVGGWWSVLENECTPVYLQNANDEKDWVARLSLIYEVIGGCWEWFKHLKYSRMSLSADDQVNWVWNWKKKASKGRFVRPHL